MSTFRRYSSAHNVSGFTSVGQMFGPALGANEELVQGKFTWSYSSEVTVIAPDALPRLAGVMGIALAGSADPTPDPGPPSDNDWLYHAPITAAQEGLDIVWWDGGTSGSASRILSIVLAKDIQLDAPRHGSAAGDQQLVLAWRFFGTISSTDLFSFYCDTELTLE